MYVILLAPGLRLQTCCMSIHDIGCRLDTPWQTLWSADVNSMCQEGCQDTWKIAATCGLTERRCRVSWLGICCRRASSIIRPAAPAAGSRCRSRDLAAWSSSGTAPSAPPVCRTVKAAPIYTHAHKQTCFSAGFCGHVYLASAACTDDRLRLLLRGKGDNAAGTSRQSCMLWDPSIERPCYQIKHGEEVGYLDRVTQPSACAMHLQHMDVLARYLTLGQG